MSAFLTARAAALLDANSLRAAAAPLSEAGIRLRDSAEPGAPDREESWRTEHDRTVRLDGLLDARPELDERLQAVLTGVRPIDEVLDRLRAGSSMREADFYRLKWFAWILVELRRQLDDALESGVLERPPAGDWSDWFSWLDPDGEGRPAFTMSDRLDDRLPALRAELTLASRDELRSSAARRAALEQEYGQRLSRDGELVLDNGHALLGAARDDARLHFVGRTHWEHVFVPRPDDAAARVSARAAELRESLEAVESEVLESLAERFRPHAGAVAAAESWIARLDLRAARCRLRRRWRGCWPEPGAFTEVVDGVVPRVQAELASRGLSATPVSLAILPGATLLTGPNMGGKTVTLTLMGTVQYLAQLGYPVPARRATFAWVRSVDYVGGELGSVRAGLSSFGGEMEALAGALAMPEPALLLLDEIGRGTNPTEGAAIADATAAWLQSARHLALVATHFPDVGRSGGAARFRVAGLSSVDDETLRRTVAEAGWQAALARYMDYRIVEDRAGSVAQDAVRVASLFGLPAPILAAAAARTRRVTGVEPSAEAPVP